MLNLNETLNLLLLAQDSANILIEKLLEIHHRLGKQEALNKICFEIVGDINCAAIVFPISAEKMHIAFFEINTESHKKNIILPPVMIKEKVVDNIYGVAEGLMLTNTLITNSLNDLVSYFNLEKSWYKLDLSSNDKGESGYCLIKDEDIIELKSCLKI